MQFHCLVSQPLEAPVEGFCRHGHVATDSHEKCGA